MCLLSGFNKAKLIRISSTYDAYQGLYVTISTWKLFIVLPGNFSPSTSPSVFFTISSMTLQPMMGCSISSFVTKNGTLTSASFTFDNPTPISAHPHYGISVPFAACKLREPLEPSNCSTSCIWTDNSWLFRKPSDTIETWAP